MSEQLLSCVEVTHGDTVSASVIWLHGLGANGHDFEPIVPELGLPADLGIRFIFPHAPELPVTINNGHVMPAWYDILEMTLDRKVDATQLRASAVAVIQLIEREIARGIPANRIVLAGFSQGGAVAYEAALSYDKALAGLMPMSTYLATADSVERHSANQAIPVHIFHGTQDPIVPESLGQTAKAQLTEWGYQPEYTTYPMEHSVCLEQIHAISKTLQAWLA